MSEPVAFLSKRGSDSPQDPAPRARDLGLEAAIADNCIDIRFQPQIDPAGGRTIAVEALARWNGEESAERLFARARRAGLDERLSRLVQRQALRIAGRWDPPLSALGLSINLLPEDLARDGYEDWLLAEVAAAGLAPGRLTVEITESGLLADQAGAAARLARLRAAGIKVAIDDFGTGYASLGYLTSLPLDALKIDRGLVAGLLTGKRDRIVVRAIIALARELDLKVVIEGVETEAQLSLIADWGCDLYQGFFGAGPLDQEQLARFVRATA